MKLKTVSVICATVAVITLNAVGAAVFLVSPKTPLIDCCLAAVLGSFVADEVRKLTVRIVGKLL